MPIAILVSITLDFSANKSSQCRGFSLRLRRCQKTKPLQSAPARVALLAEPGEEQAPQVGITTAAGLYQASSAWPMVLAKVDPWRDFG
jgi:hypothetical protein